LYISALNWLGGKSFDDRNESANEAEAVASNAASVVGVAAIGTPENQAIVNAGYQPIRKYSMYMKNNSKMPKGAR
jgi:acetate kinase